MENQDLIKTMEDKATVAGSVVRHVASMEEAIHYVVDVCHVKGMRTIADPDLSEKNHQILIDICNNENLEVLDPPLRNISQQIDVGFTYADYGIADTGTLMLKSSSEDIRLATMLSQIHIAVLHVQNIRKDTSLIEEDLDAILKSDSPSYTAFITGPSRTADIERVLAIGVHGPGELHLLLLEDSQS